MSVPKTVIFNVNEQLTSSDLNSLQLGLGAELSDTIARLLAADQIGFTGDPVSGAAGGGVLTGFEPSFVSGTTLQFNPGVAYRTNNSPPAGQSTYRWIKSTAVVQQSVIVTGVQLWALIEVTDQITQLPGGGTSRNVWVPASNAVVAQTVFKNQDSTPPLFTIKYSVGVSSIPTVDAGNIPLAYVLVPVAGSISSTSIFDARQMLTPGGYNRTGVSEGLMLGWNGILTFSPNASEGTACNALIVGAGRGWVNGFPINLPTKRAFSAAGGGAVSAWIADTAAAAIGTGPAANTAFYCYLVPNSTGAAMVNQADPTVQFNTNGIALMICAVAPASDGRPSGPVVIATSAAAPMPFSNQSSLFIGSIVTNSSGNIIPFSRNGDEVQLTTSFNAYGGIHTVAYGTVSGSIPKATAIGGTAIPASAESMICDVLVSTNDTNGQNMYLLDPRPFGGLLANLPTTSTIMGNLGASCILQATLGSGATSINYQTRVHWRHDTTGHLWSSPSAGATFSGATSLSLFVEVMGYVEPIHKLPAV